MKSAHTFLCSLLLFTYCQYGCAQSLTHTFVQGSIGFGKTSSYSNNTYQVGLIAGKLLPLHAALAAEVGIGLQYTMIPTYYNPTLYKSNWVNGTYEVNVNKTATINQLFVRIPLGLSFSSFYKLTWALGVNLDYLLLSRMEQLVHGEYNNPDFPAAKDNFTRTVKYVHEIPETGNKSAFTPVNFVPYISGVYKLSEDTQLRAQVSCTIVREPEFDLRLKPFRTMVCSLQYVYLLNTGKQ